MKIGYQCFLIDKERQWPWQEWPLIMYDESMEKDSFDVTKIESLDPLTFKIPKDKKELLRHTFTLEEAEQIKEYYKEQFPDLYIKSHPAYEGKAGIIIHVSCHGESAERDVIDAITLLKDYFKSNLANSEIVIVEE